MEYFREIFQKIIATIVIRPSDSEIDKAKKIIWYSFFGSIIIIFVISWIIFIALTFNNDKVKVPMINGDDVYEGLRKLYDKRLVSNVMPKYNDKVDTSVIYNQSPKQGSIVKRGRIISFNVSLGPRKSSLPDFRGFTLFELEDYLNKEYPSNKMPYEIENPIYEFNNEIEKGRIFDQEPEDGVPIYKVKKVKFWISNGIKDEGASKIGNYINRNVEEVSKELSDLEILYTYEFQMINSRNNDMVVVDQSISEGRLVDEIIEESKIMVLKVNRFRYIDGKRIKGTYLLDVPKKPLPFLLEVKIKNGNAREKSILKEMTKGGVSIPIPYTGKENSKLMVYYDGKFIIEIDIITEGSETN